MGDWTEGRSSDETQRTRGDPVAGLVRRKAGPAESAAQTGGHECLQSRVERRSQTTAAGLGVLLECLTC